MTRINFGWAIGKTLEAKAYQEDGSYRESDIALSDMTGKGLYLGASTSDLTPSDDVLVYDIATSDVGPVGFGEYDYNINKVVSDLVVADAVIDDIYSDTAIIISNIQTAISDLIVVDAIVDDIYSDTSIAVSDIKVVMSHLIVADTVIDDIYSDTSVAVSDIQTAISDLDLIYTAVRTRTHTFHLDEE